VSQMIALIAATYADAFLYTSTRYLVVWEYTPQRLRCNDFPFMAVSLIKHGFVRQSSPI